MSETPPNPETQDPQNAPSMRMVTQYLKDLSFENPNAPQSLAASAERPAMEVTVDVNGRALPAPDADGDPLPPTRFEVELSCSATAKRDGNVLYVCEVNYAGLLEIKNVPQDRLEPLLLVDAPYLLFPFVRQVVAQSTRDGGFQPLMLEPLDFMNMYQSQKAQAAGGAPAQVS